MVKIQFDNFTFCYPKALRKALEEVSFTIEPGEFVVVCGKSGCGKSTLLRQLKKQLIPYGGSAGRVLIDGCPASDMGDRESVSRVGFVQQNPDNQLVTDRVWHELAFGPESLGWPNDVIKRRVAETAAFFDIQGWFRKDTASLSGGQKQLLNLASVSVMQPELLILDEPTSQLDPIAASEFLASVHKLNREMGITVVISEHRLEEVFTMADRVLVLDEGKVVAFDEPGRVAGLLFRENHDMAGALPAVMRIYAEVECAGADSHAEGAAPAGAGDSSNSPAGASDYATASAGDSSPITIREGRIWLENYLRRNGLIETVLNSKVQEEAGECNTREIEISDIYFSYGKNEPQVLKGASLDIMKGECFCLLGGNGSGKSTLLKALCGVITPAGGTISYAGAGKKSVVDGGKRDSGKTGFAGQRVVMLPQDPKALFTEITAADELLEALYYAELSDEEKAERAREMAGLMCLEGLLETNPYDLSGGEQQRLAIGKLLIQEPDVLLLDEPTKGLDPFFKGSFAGIINELKDRGVTIVMASHDIEYCAEHCDRATMLFDGEVLPASDARAFLAGNSFYTTAASRIAGRYFPRAVTAGDVVDALRGAKAQCAGGTDLAGGDGNGGAQ